MVAQFVFLFLSRAMYRETLTEMDVKTVNVIEKTNWQQFSMVFILINHRNDVKMFKTFFDVISNVDRGTDNGKLLSIANSKSRNYTGKFSATDFSW